MVFSDASLLGHVFITNGSEKEDNYVGRSVSFRTT